MPQRTRSLRDVVEDVLLASPRLGATGIINEIQCFGWACKPSFDHIVWQVNVLRGGRRCRVYSFCTLKQFAIKGGLVVGDDYGYECEVFPALPRLRLAT